ncbi:MAG: hypothetical protein HY255_03195 [Betaproteobacteria bacterium]|nr:hypothetical protein [Betaproteobacteria bacterium]
MTKLAAMGAASGSRAPAGIKRGVNPRGAIVPLADFRVKFSVGEIAYNDFAVGADEWREF